MKLEVINKRKSRKLWKLNNTFKQLMGQRRNDKEIRKYLNE